MAIGEQAQKTPRYYTVAVIFLGFIIIITGVILAYSISVGLSNEKSKEKLESLNTSITALSNDPDIQAFQLYDDNKKQIENMAYFSNIPLFYEEITDISKEFAINLSQFSYSNKKISVAASGITNPASPAYRKYENLISAYREDVQEGEDAEEREERIFDLEFVRGFEGSNRIVTNLDFTILEPKIEVVKEEEGEESSTGSLDIAESDTELKEVISEIQ